MPKLFANLHGEALWAEAREKLAQRISVEHRGHVIAGVPSECHIFTGGHSGRGRGGFYGRIRFHGFMWAAHRLSWRAQRGPIPEGFDVDHMCYQRGCIRVEHLEPITHSENQQRRAHRAATLCATEMAERDKRRALQSANPICKPMDDWPAGCIRDDDRADWEKDDA